MYEDPKWGSTKIVYLSKYLPVDDPMYTMSDEDLIKFSIPHLQRMFPHFGADKIVGSHVWRAEHAQPIITPNYSRIKPAQISSVTDLFMASMAHIFPEDRGVNYALKQGRELGYLVGERLLVTDDLDRAQYV
jgi:protoporphyrinogen oxidase